MKLTLKINLAIIITFIVIAVIFSIIQFPFQRNRLNNSINRIELILNTIAERERIHFANEIFEKRERAIRIRLKNLINIDNVLLIAVFDENKKLIWQEEKNNSGKNIILNNFSGDLHDYLIESVKYNNKTVLKYSQPIYAIGDKFGYIVILYSLSDIILEQRIEFILIIGLLLAILFIMLFLLNLLILKTIVNPISYLRNIMLKTEKKGPGLVSNIISRDEIGDLSNAFNKMSTALNNSYNKNKKQQKKLVKSLSEKNILFKELHHRVKNNLNMILAMIDVQFDNIDDEVMIDSLRKLQNRIYSVALIYKLLYKMHEIDKIDFKEYIVKFLENIIESYNLNDEKIEIIIEIDECKLDIDTIKTCGIIINELITNSIKHAFNFTDNKKKIIKVLFKKIKKEYCFIIKDNGTGMDEVKIDDSSTMGLNLVKLLCYEINADMELKNDNGLEIKIVFPVK